MQEQQYHHNDVSNLDELLKAVLVTQILCLHGAARSRSRCRPAKVSIFALFSRRSDRVSTVVLVPIAVHSALPQSRSTSDAGVDA